jgi:cytosine/uracil/thiamine/allantoin permease
MGRAERPTRAGLAASLQSKEAFIEYFQAPQGNDSHTAIGDSKWSNKDLQPTSVEDRTWTWYVVRNLGTICLFTGSPINFLWLVGTLGLHWLPLAWYVQRNQK